MDDILKSIKAYLYDRSTSPLFGAYISAWLIWNYRVIVILISSESVASKFSAIDNYFSNINITVLGHSYYINGHMFNSLIIPSIATSIYLYVYPLLAKPVYEHSLRKNKELREAKHNAEESRLLTIEESHAIAREISELRYKYENEIEKYRKQISSLNHTIDELLSERSDGSKNNTSDVDTATNTYEPDIEDYDTRLISEAGSLLDGEFQLSDLFSSDEWQSLSANSRKSLGKRFKLLVDIGDIADVLPIRKGSGNQQIYLKTTRRHDEPSSDTLSKKEIEILQKFIGLDPGKWLTAKEINSFVGGHIEETRMHLSELQEHNLLTLSGHLNEEPQYRLTEKGRKYLVSNNLLEIISA
jgi:hypothetical protein